MIFSNTKSLQFIIISIVFIFFIPSCNNSEQSKLGEIKQLVNSGIIIQPFQGISEEQINHLNKELKKVFPKVKINPVISLPKHAFYKSRNRYRADTLINFLKTKTPSGFVTIGLTNKDISHTKGNIQDYGIMGLGYRPGSSCIISNYRLDKINLNEQLFKLAVHELGHTQGLPHCPIKTCYMRDAEGKNHKNEETSFCSKCKQYLKSHGWKLN